MVVLPGFASMSRKGDPLCKPFKFSYNVFFVTDADVDVTVLTPSPVGLFVRGFSEVLHYSTQLRAMPNYIPILDVEGTRLNYDVQLFFSDVDVRTGAQNTVNLPPLNVNVARSPHYVAEPRINTTCADVTEAIGHAESDIIIMSSGHIVFQNGTVVLDNDLLQQLNGTNGTRNDDNVNLANVTRCMNKTYTVNVLDAIVDQRQKAANGNTSITINGNTTLLIPRIMCPRVNYICINVTNGVMPSYTEINFQNNKRCWDIAQAKTCLGKWYYSCSVYAEFNIIRYNIC